MTIKQNISATGLTQTVYTDFHNDSMQGLGELLISFVREVKPDERPSVEISAEPEEDMLRTYFNRTGKWPTGPFIRIQPESTQQVTDFTFNRHVMMTDGFRMGVTKDRAHSLIMHAFPKIITANISIYTTNYQLILDLVKVLEFTAFDIVEYSLDMNDPKFSIPIKVQFEPNFTLPTRETIDGYGSAFRFNFAVGVRTYAGRIEKVPNLERVHFQPIISGSNAYEANLKELQANQYNNEHTPPDAIGFTINLRDRATSQTMD